MSTFQIATSKPIKATLLSVANEIKKLKPESIEISIEELSTLTINITKNNPLVFQFDCYNLKYRKGLLNNWFTQKPVFLAHGAFKPISLYEYIVFLETLHQFASRAVVGVDDPYWREDKRYTQEDYRSIFRHLKENKIKDTLKSIGDHQSRFAFLTQT